MEGSYLFDELCRDFFFNGISHELKLEFDDGTVIDDYPVSLYVDLNRFRDIEKRFLGYAKGNVLDIGCGPGRVCTYLSQNGFDVMGIDRSDAMLEICKTRRINVAKMDVSLPVGKIFDSIIMYGNGFGMAGTIDNVKSLLERLNNITSRDAIIIAESNDPYLQHDPLIKTYQQRNLKLGRYVGQRVWRIISEKSCSEFMPWLQAETGLLEKIAEETGWRIMVEPEIEKGSGYDFGTYFFVLNKK